jgi:hypothetical protein
MNEKVVVTVWVVSSIYRNFLGIYLCKENVLVLTCFPAWPEMHYRGSNSAAAATTNLGKTRWSRG